MLKVLHVRNAGVAVMSVLVLASCSASSASSANNECSKARALINDLKVVLNHKPGIKSGVLLANAQSAQKVSRSLISNVPTTVSAGAGSFSTALNGYLASGVSFVNYYSKYHTVSANETTSLRNSLTRFEKVLITPPVQKFVLNVYSSCKINLGLEKAPSGVKIAKG